MQQLLLPGNAGVVPSLCDRIRRTTCLRRALANLYFAARGELQNAFGAIGIRDGNDDSKAQANR